MEATCIKFTEGNYFGKLLQSSSIKDILDAELCSKCSN